jgi:hypothetical protein
MEGVYAEQLELFLLAATFSWRSRAPLLHCSIAVRSAEVAAGILTVVQHQFLEGAFAEQLVRVSELILRTHTFVWPSAPLLHCGAQRNLCRQQ